MRTAVTIAVVLALLGVVALCPAFACFAPAAAHPCCPHHKAPAASENCPSLVLENGKASPIFSAVAAGPSATGMAAPRIETTSSLPADAPVEGARELILLLRTLRI